MRAMFLRAVEGGLTLVLYAVSFWLGFIVVGLFVLIFFQAPWTALLAGVLGGLFVVWFVRGLMRNVDEALDPVVDRITGNTPQAQNPGPRRTRIPTTASAASRSPARKATGAPTSTKRNGKRYCES